MDPKEILSKEISGKVGDKINKQTIREKVDYFVRHGNMFLLFEVISLRKELESLREEIKQQRRSGRSQKSARVLLIP